MPALLTLQGIDETLDNLELKEGTLKAELAKVIRSYFVDESSIQSIASIPTDEIVIKIWGPCQDEELKAKKKNFSSLKSALNKSLKDLDKAGKNQAGIIVGRDNVFIVSEERKDDLLKQMGLSPNSPHLLHDMLAAFKKFFSENIKEQNVQEVKDLLAEFEEAQKKLKKLVGLEPEAEIDEKAPETAVPSPEKESGEKDSTETVELLEGDEFEVIEESEEIEVLDEEEIEEIVGEERDDIQLLEEEVEIIDADEIEEVREEEAPLDQGLGEEEGGPPEEGCTEEVEVLDEDELEEIVGEEHDDTQFLQEEVEVIDADEIEEVCEEEAPLDQGLGEEEGGPPEEGSTEEVEVLDEDELEEIVEEEHDDTQFLEEEVEVIDADEIEEVCEEEAPLDQGLGEEEGGPPEEGSTEEVEVLGEDEIEEVLEEEAPLDQGLGGEECGPPEEGSTEEVEVLDEDEVEEIVGEECADTQLLEEEVELIDADEIEEVLDEEAPFDQGLGEEEGGLPEEGITEEVEVLDEDELEEIVEKERDDTPFLEEEVEIIEEGDLEEIEGVAEPLAEKLHQPSPLEVLSKYIEAEEAINQGELLRETQEEFINQILERFMPKFIKIPAGVYLVGSATPKGLEQPLRKVMLHDFYLGQSPVTNDLFDMFVRETGYLTDAEEAGYGIVFEGRCTNKIDPETGREIFSLNRGTLARHVSGANWRHPAGPGSSLEGKHNHPVVQVSHRDAMAFAAWAGKRLPTEEEWEAAARGASGQLFPWGNMWLAELGNFEATCLGGTSSVEHFGRKAMSPFGIHDLLGNVAEWTSSPHAGQTEPQPGRSVEKIYIIKGGSWITGGTVTAAWRQIEQGKYWTNTIGFRCAV
ncbi:MAG: formylglycine-generating enzyme family protein [Desulfobulbaceae bacterium]|nr:formylglycine-generating enzyme family protein [Desulfobulbaceae bacterium]HIJ90232.1 SUMF1/EgtB/PvdO family nonheme iron enzyme [Deltaproteobacteria bacterium]